MNNGQIVAAIVSGVLICFAVVTLWASGAFDGFSIRKWFRRGHSDKLASSLESMLDGWLDSKAAEWRTDLQGFKDLDAVRAEKNRLEDQVAKLTETMENASLSLERERQGIEFNLGLEKQRRDQEHEFAEERLKQAEARLEAEKVVAIREASVQAREEALQVSAEQNGEFLKVQAELIDTLTEALPKAEILAKIGNGS